MKIVDLDPRDEAALRQAASLLVSGFRENAPHAWPDLDAGLHEVRDLFAEGCIARAAVDADGTVLGWIAATSRYDGHSWELHPLVVDPRHQRQGIGRALVADLEEHVRHRGAVTLYLGTDDENDLTSLAGVNLYEDVLGHLSRMRNLRQHPYEFYEKQGFTVVGVLPDANGPGKPDILMAKRIAERA